MENKKLKWYEAPQVEIVEMETETALLTVSDQITPPEGEDGKELKSLFHVQMFY